MSIEQDPHQTHLNMVRTYYETAQKYYYLAWHGEAAGLHYGFWDENTRYRREAITNEVEVLAKLANIQKGDRVLDAGSGVSGSSAWLTKNIEANVTDLNVVEKQLRAGRRRIKRQFLFEEPRPNTVNADYHNMPFGNNSFEVFWSLESIEHSDNLPQFASEAHRVLKTGGKAIIAGTFLGDVKPTDEQSRQMEVGQRAAGAFNDFRTANAVVGLLDETGFKVEANLNMTNSVIKSARQMHNMCTLGLPFAKLGNKMGVISDIMVDNTAWGTYQKDLFEAGVTSYNVLLAMKM